MIPESWQLARGSWQRNFGK